MPLQVEILIENVQKYPILFDLTNKENKNIRKKDKIWDKIALTMEDVTGDELKKKWKNLRDSYSKYLRVEKSNPGQGPKLLRRYKTWPWAKQMEFLRPFVHFAKTEPYVTHLTNSLTEPQQTEEEQVSYYIDDENFVQNQVNLKTNQLIRQNARRIIHEQPKKIHKDTVSVRPPSTTAIQQVISYLEKRNNTSCDGIDDIFRGYAKTVKKLSPRRQAIVKFKFSRILMEEEIGQLEDEEETISELENKSYSTNSSLPSFSSPNPSRPHSRNSITPPIVDYQN